MFCFLVILV